MNTGFIKVSAVSPRVTVANVEKNLQNALKTVKAESESGSSLIVFPELYLTAYTCGDLFLQDALIQSALDALIKFSKETAYSDAVIFIIAPLFCRAELFSELCRKRIYLTIMNTMRSGGLPPPKR